MGMLFDPMQMLDHLPLTLATLAVIMIGKPLAALAVTRVLRQPGRTSIAVSVALAQVGEFSFMVASLGLSLGVLPPEATQALIAASIISITLNPALFKLVDPLSKRLARPAQVSEILAPAEEGHIIVVGYGAVGRQIVALLADNNLTPTVVDLNADTVHHLRNDGIRAIYGDASMREILQAADIHHARALIFSSNAPTFETVRTAIDLNENIAVLTRTTYSRDAESLRRVGASVVVSEVEVALAMTENILMRLGATAEQLDRARERVRGEFGGPSEQGAIRELRSLHEPA
jgi:CPA2 family monovalent cation:H+ antiporter-2